MVTQELNVEFLIKIIRNFLENTLSNLKIRSVLAAALIKFVVF